MNDLTAIFKELSDGNRLRALAALSHKCELCACQITELLQVTSATVSRHMGILINAELVRSRKDTRWVYYSLNIENKTLKPVLAWLQQQFAQKPEFQQDKISLENITSCQPEELYRKQQMEKNC